MNAVTAIPDGLPRGGSPDALIGTFGNPPSARAVGVRDSLPNLTARALSGSIKSAEAATALALKILFLAPEPSPGRQQAVLGDPMGFVTFKAAYRTVDRSRMTPLGKARAREVLQLCARHVVVNSDLVACPTGDDGMTIEIAPDATQRDVLFAMPEEGSPLYFTARAERGFRRAGVVSDASAVANLVEWAEGRTGVFPSNGLRIG